MSKRPLHNSPGKRQPLPCCRAVPCQDAALPAAPSKEADRQAETGTRGGRVTEKQPGFPAALPAQTCINVTVKAARADSYLASPCRRLERCQPPGLLFPYPHRPAQQLQGTVSKLSLVEDSGPKAASTLPSPTHVPSLAPLHPWGTGRRAWDKHGKSRMITPELVPVT